MSKPKNDPRPARALHLVNEVRNLINKIDGATFELGEVLTEIDDLALELDDALLDKVWKDVEPVYSALDGKTNSNSAESAIAKYLQQRR